MLNVMIVDDSVSNIAHLSRLLRTCLNIQIEGFEQAAVAFDAAVDERFDLLIFDHLMPEMDGITFIRRLRSVGRYGQVPIVLLTGTSDREVELEALRAGVADFLFEADSQIGSCVKLRNLVALSRAVRQTAGNAAILAQQVEHATRTSRAAEEQMILRLSLAVEYRDNETGEHTLRGARYTRLIAEEMRLAAETCRSLYSAATLHDVGKIAVPDHILLKPGPLDREEAALMQTHTLVGERTLGKGSCDLMRLVAEIAGRHHERWDGTGYPRRLAGEAIPLSTRRVAVADVFDALTTERPYKPALPMADALDILRDERTKHFNTRYVDAFLTAHSQQGSAVWSCSAMQGGMSSDHIPVTART